MSPVYSRELWDLQVLRNWGRLYSKKAVNTGCPASAETPFCLCHKLTPSSPLAWQTWSWFLEWWVHPSLSQACLAQVLHLLSHPHLPTPPQPLSAFGVKGKETRVWVQDLASSPSSPAAQTSSERVSTSFCPRCARLAGLQWGSGATMRTCYTDRRYYANSNKFLLWLNTEYKTLIHIPISYNIFKYYIWLDILNPPALCMSAKDWKQLK